MFYLSGRKWARLFLAGGIITSSPGFRGFGIRFILSLLSHCNLIEVNKDNFKLIGEEEIKEDDETEEPKEGEEEIPSDSKYKITIKGKDLNLQFNISELSDIDDVETILSIIRKKLT